MRSHVFALGSTLLVAIAASSGGCSAFSGSSFGGAGWGDDGGTLFGGGYDGGSFGGDDGGSDECTAQGLPSTTITGTVYDPAGNNPLYDVVVFVPAKPVEPFPKGVTCDKCGVLLSGQPVTSTLSDPTGHFALKRVPAGDDVPLVLQIGKWRRQVTVPHVEHCATTNIADKNLTRLPRSKSEGDIPQFAITTGQCDPFECLLRKIGISDSEFTTESGDGRVHVYQGAGAANPQTGQESRGAQLAQPTTSAQSFWADSARLMNYDIAINSCECREHEEEKPQASIDDLVKYAGAGGRLFNTHYQYFWLDPQFVSGESSPWTPTAQFIPESVPQDNGTVTDSIDTSFPKGQAFATWLQTVGATSGAGLPITQPRYNAATTSPPSVRWIYGTNSVSQGPALMHYTFNTPVGASDDQQCGKVLFSDFHVVLPFDLSQPPPPTATFPQECNSNPMTPQEKALEFMLFDLSACIQKDTNPPVVPK